MRNLAIPNRSSSLHIHVDIDIGPETSQDSTIQKQPISLFTPLDYPRDSGPIPFMHRVYSDGNSSTSSDRPNSRQSFSQPYSSAFSLSETLDLPTTIQTIRLSDLFDANWQPPTIILPDPASSVLLSTHTTSTERTSVFVEDLDPWNADSPITPPVMSNEELNNANETGEAEPTKTEDDAKPVGRWKYLKEKILRLARTRRCGGNVRCVPIRRGRRTVYVETVSSNERLS
ncbi:hypothetical protein BJ508DRAFT_23037 [Ascobolus immersus RN42]|uniref:Uncharacterized protein n=1 Tax=Ascobolus immersus RN42 TaxID=1160509 RepID=A0A3N4HRX8_ASCIM|nr:hypothetical protein BJ508DRAFT_23037 [Ascobolus immersus RN42]